MIFEPLLFANFILSFTLLWIANENSRADYDVKTGRSKLTIFRVLSKRASLDMPNLMPFFCR